MTDITSRPPVSSTATGIAFGLMAAFMWSAFVIASRMGAVGGLQTVDMMTLRFGIAGLVLAPVLVWIYRKAARGSQSLTLGRALVLTLAAGPVFVWLNVGGFQFAPLAHGAVIQPATIALAGMALAALWLGEALSRMQMIGAAFILFGIAAIAGPGLQAVSPDILIGDAMFVGAGLFWVAYTLLLKRWHVPGLLAAAAVSVMSAAIVIPVAAVTGVVPRLSALTTSELLIQATAHGLFAGVGAIVAFGLAVERLGAGRAALFPALVPATTLIIGLPITGERPSSLELVGAVCACVGLVVAMAAGHHRTAQAFGPSRT